MDKLVFRKLASDILVFFVISSCSVALIVWILQAVNLLDIISDDGHDLNIYFSYALLTLPKIYSKIILFVFFISVFYVINKYNENNEILVFWINGIKKIQFINFILKLSIFFLFIQIIFSTLIVPYSENLSRVLLKNSNINFFPSLISEKKFINIFKNLTFFVEDYDDVKSELRNIYIKEKINDDETKIIVAKSGIIEKNNNTFSLKLFNGSITTNNNDNIFKIKFQESNYDLSNFGSKTTTYSKMKHYNSLFLIKCLKFTIFQKLEKTNKICPHQDIQNIKNEFYERFVSPFYIIIISLISSMLIIKPKKIENNTLYKIKIFVIGFMISILAQSNFKFTFFKDYSDQITFLIPVLLVFIFYFMLLMKTKFNFKKL